MPPLDETERNAQIVPDGDLVLAPNPAHGYVEVSFPANLGESTLLLTDMWGRLILQHRIPEAAGITSLTIPTDGVPNGIYLISVRAKLGKLLTKKLAVTH